MASPTVPARFRALKPADPWLRFQPQTILELTDRVLARRTLRASGSRCLSGIVVAAYGRRPSGSRRSRFVRRVSMAIGSLLRHKAKRSTRFLGQYPTFNLG